MIHDKPRILVVDDEKFNRTVLTELLKKDYTVLLAKNGQQALDKAHSDHPPNLILLDILMPGMDGYTVCKQLKASPITRDIPVIFVTAMHDEEDEKTGLDMGAIDYIAKPFRPAIVQARLRNHIALEQARQKLAEAHFMLSLKNKELEKMASRDALTGLNNRFSLDEAMSHELNKAQRYERPLSVSLMDIDNFKEVNDTHGHQAGDLVLKKFANLLEEHIRESDTLGRWGGEEFLMICPETNQQGIVDFADKLRRMIELQPFPVVEKPITASFGTTSYSHGDTIESLLRRADKALYKAKELGRNQVQSC